MIGRRSDELRSKTGSFAPPIDNRPAAAYLIDIPFSCQNGPFGFVGSGKEMPRRSSGHLGIKSSLLHFPSGSGMVVD